MSLSHPLSYTEPASLSEKTPEANLVPLSPMPTDRLERVWAWGMASSAMGYVYRPTTVEGIREVFALARERALCIGMRGAGRSYGDASLSAEHISLDLTRMTRILDWNPQTGLITVEPGVSIRQIWQYTIEDGWWPPVVSGTMFPTLGGAAAMNIHGKNNFKVGPIGSHIRQFEILLPTGELKACSREENSDLFHAAIGGFGMLGCFTSLTLQLKKVYSGLLNVTPVSVGNFTEMFRVFEERMEMADYLVGWVDCFGKGEGLGRGLIHQANYLRAGEDPQPAQTLRVENQELPDTFLGIFPKSIMWMLMKPFANNLGMKTVNFAKYHLSKRHSGHSIRQSHAGFAFLLDYVPNWKWAYKPGGLIQYQSFIPAAHAEEVFRAQLTLAQERGLVPYLGVFKRHRTDPFLMTHAVDGYSLALDFKVTAKNRQRLWNLAADMDKLVVAAGGRFYFAKDSTLRPESLTQYLQEERVQKFLALKRQCDPDNLLQTNLYRRLFTSE